MGWSRFKFKNMGAALGIALKFTPKGPKLKSSKFYELIPTFAEVASSYKYTQEVSKNYCDWNIDCK